MTDTVNVPREPTPEMIAAACGDREEHPVMKYLTPEDRGGAAILPLAYWRAMIAAAPKDEPVQFTVGELTMDKVFRRSGLTNLSDLQAVLDAVEAALSSAQPEAQKGEPVAWRGRISETSSVWDYRNFDMTGEIWSSVEPLYTHPAPSSELLESMDAIREIAGARATEGWNERGRLKRIEERATQAIAQHKGPQS